MIPVGAGESSSAISGDVQVYLVLWNVFNSYIATAGFRATEELTVWMVSPSAMFFDRATINKVFHGESLVQLWRYFFHTCRLCSLLFLELITLAPVTPSPQPQTFHPTFKELIDWHLHWHHKKFKLRFCSVNWNTLRQNLGKDFVKTTWFSIPWTELLASLCSSLSAGFWNYHLPLSLTAFGFSPEMKIPNPGTWTNIIENHLPNITHDSMFAAEKRFKTVSSTTNLLSENNEIFSKHFFFVNPYCFR